jgi:sec-independent protein translocase protein TatA
MSKDLNSTISKLFEKLCVIFVSTMKILFTILTCFVIATTAFAPPRVQIGSFSQTQKIPASILEHQPVALLRQRKSVASIQTKSLFGLGAPELVVIAIAAAFLLGPQKLAELGKDAGKIAGELKEIPKEFQQGMAEGEKQAKEYKKQIAGDDVKDAEKE